MIYLTLAILIVLFSHMPSCMVGVWGTPFLPVPAGQVPEYIFSDILDSSLLDPFGPVPADHRLFSVGDSVSALIPIGVILNTTRTLYIGSAIAGLVIIAEVR